MGNVAAPCARWQFVREPVRNSGSVRPLNSIVSRHRQSVPMLNIKRACLAAAVLFPMAAYGSFGGAPCRGDFACHFVTWGILVGAAAGIPISILIFAVLHLCFCNRARSKVAQLFLGGFIGIIAYEISAVCAALMGAWGESAAGHHGDYPVIGFVSGYVVLAIVSVLYARSSPRHRLRGEGGVSSRGD